MPQGMRAIVLCGLVAALGAASWAHGATYQVTLATGPDQPDTGDYTLAGAIAAANLDDQPAEVLITLPVVWLDTPLSFQNTISLSSADPDRPATIGVVDGVATAFWVDLGGRGSQVSHVVISYEGMADNATAIALCDTDLLIHHLVIAGFATGLALHCGAEDLTADRVSFSANGRALAGELGAEAVLTLTNIGTDSSAYAWLDLQAPECGGQVRLERLWAWGHPSMVFANTLRLTGCVDLQVRDGRFLFGALLLDADSLPSGDDSLVPTLVLDQVLVYGYASADQPLIRQSGGSLTLRHSTLTQNRISADHCLTFTGELHLDHTVLADNQCSTATLSGDATLTYSLVDIDWLGGTLNADATSTALWGQSPALEGLLPSPSPDSPLRDAGDPALVPGMDGTPLRDIRGSARLTGLAIDIGAAEFNRPPVLDLAGLLAHRRTQLQGRAADDLVVLDLKRYISDPDDHDVEVIDMQACAFATFAGESGCFLLQSPAVLDTDNGTLTASAETLRRRLDIYLEVRDELGLTAGLPVTLPREGGSGGGSAAGLVILLALLRRRRQR